MLPETPKTAQKYRVANCPGHPIKITEMAWFGQETQEHRTECLELFDQALVFVVSSGNKERWAGGYLLCFCCCCFVCTGLNCPGLSVLLPQRVALQGHHHKVTCWLQRELKLSLFPSPSENFPNGVLFPIPVSPVSIQTLAIVNVCIPFLNGKDERLTKV